MGQANDRATARTRPCLFGPFLGACVAAMTFAGAVPATATGMVGTPGSFRFEPRSAVGAGEGFLSSRHVLVRSLPVFVFGDYEGLRPRTIAFSGDAGDIVESLRWSSWTGSHATGTGKSVIQGCVPGCATGAEILVPTLITLQDPLDGAFTKIIERRDGQNETFIYTRRPARGRFPEIDRAPRLAGPVVSLEYYWGDIDTGAYANAWTYLAAAGDTQAAFVQSEKEARPTNIELLGTLIGISGDRARIDLNRLMTHDRQYGCRIWSGYYALVKTGGKWLIDSAHISPTAC